MTPLFLAKIREMKTVQTSCSSPKTKPEVRSQGSGVAARLGQVWGQPGVNHCSARKLVGIIKMEVGEERDGQSHLELLVGKSGIQDEEAGERLPGGNRSRPGPDLSSGFPTTTRRKTELGVSQKCSLPSSSARAGLPHS